MKKLLAIIFLFSVVAVSGQTLTVKKQPLVSKMIVEDSIGKYFIQQDSVKTDTIVLKTDNEMKLAKLIVAQDTIQTKVVPPPKPGPDAKPIEWLNYLIGILAVIVVGFMARWPAINKWMINSGIEFLVRLASETSSFLKKIGATCFSISVIAGGIITSGIVKNPYVLSILDYVVVICLAITGVVMLTKKDKEPKPEPSNPQ
jgi:hypothetical protein